MDDDGFNDLLIRVRRLTGLDGRDAAKVAFELGDDPRPQDIMDKAAELGFEVEKLHEDEPAPASGGFAGHVSMNPAEVLSEVYMVMPRVLCQEIPRVGAVPDEARQYEGMEEIIDALPEAMKLLLVKIDVLEGAATFWLKDEANDVDRPIGPINLSEYVDAEAGDIDVDGMVGAFETLLGRLPRVLAADWN